MARVRTKERKSPRTFQMTYCYPGGYEYPGEPYSFDGYTMTEYFSDEVGSKRDFHPCTHLRSDFHFTSLPSYTVEDPDLGSYTVKFKGYPQDVFEGSWYTPNPLTPAKAGQLSHRALMNAIKQVPMEVSIANFLIELKNPKELLPRIERWLSRHGPSDILLWWKFGIEPTIRDVKAMVGLLGRTRRRLDHLRKVNGRTVTIRMRDSFDLDPIELDESPFVEYPSTLVWRTSEKRRAKVVVNMQVRYKLEGLDSPLALLDAMGSALGLTNPAAIAWEAIPFSFVVDWFVRVGDWIEANLDLQPFRGTVEVVSCSHSVKWESHRTYYVPTTPLGDWYPFGFVHTYGYTRNHGLPLGSLMTDGLTAQQQLLGAALLNSLGGVAKRRGRSKH